MFPQRATTKYVDVKGPTKPPANSEATERENPQRWLQARPPKNLSAKNAPKSRSLRGNRQNKPAATKHGAPLYNQNKPGGKGGSSDSTAFASTSPRLLLVLLPLLALLLLGATPPGSSSCTAARPEEKKFSPRGRTGSFGGERKVGEVFSNGVFVVDSVVIVNTRVQYSSIHQLQGRR